MYADPAQVRDVLVAVWEWLASPAAIGGLSALAALGLVFVAIWPPCMDRLCDHYDEIRSIGLCAWLDWYVALPLSQWLDEWGCIIRQELDALMPDTERRPSRIRALIVHGLCTVRREEARKRRGEEGERL